MSSHETTEREDISKNSNYNSSSDDKSNSTHNNNKGDPPFVDDEGEFVTKLNLYDVLLGRGQHTSEYEGNSRLRKAALDRREEYVNGPSRQYKHSVAVEILETVTNNGGRYLRRIEDPEFLESRGFHRDAHVYVRVTDRIELLGKIKQLARDIGTESRKKRVERKRLRKRKREEWRAKQKKEAEKTGETERDRETEKPKEDLSKEYPPRKHTYPPPPAPPVASHAYSSPSVSTSASLRPLQREVPAAPVVLVGAPYTVISAPAPPPPPPQPGIWQAYYPPQALPMQTGITQPVLLALQAPALGAPPMVMMYTRILSPDQHHESYNPTFYTQPVPFFSNVQVRVVRSSPCPEPNRKTSIKLEGDSSQSSRSDRLPDPRGIMTESP
uniref:DUF6824 domain-containing protein n=1 Tax=Amphora coffeiformis TaxID=265554 RepID=A0A7S3KXF4_9STRA